MEPGDQRNVARRESQLDLLLIPHLGIDGAAVAWAVTVVLNNGVTAALVWRFVVLFRWGADSSWRWGFP